MIVITMKKPLSPTQVNCIRKGDFFLARKFNIKKQISKLYLVTSIGYFQIAGASRVWIIGRDERGFSLSEIGMLEMYFSHCELPF